MDDEPHRRPMLLIQQTTLHLQRLQSRLQRLHDLGHHRSPTNVPIRTGLQFPHVLFYNRARGDCRGVSGLSTPPKQLDQVGECAHLLQCGGEYSAGEYYAVFVVVYFWVLV